MGSANQKVIITNAADNANANVGVDGLEVDIQNSNVPIGILVGNSRLGNFIITRDSDDYITSIVITQGGTTRTLTISRNSNHYITSISEVIS